MTVTAICDQTIKLGWLKEFLKAIR